MKTIQFKTKISPVVFLLFLTAWEVFVRSASIGWADIKYNPIDTPAQQVNIEKITAGMFMDVVNTGKRLVAVGERGHIITSEDDGKSWNQAKVPVSTTLTAVCFSSCDKGWAVGYGGVILHTEDGGLTWAMQLNKRRIPALYTAGIDNLILKLETASPVEQADIQKNTTLIENMKFLRDDWQMYLDADSCPAFLNVWFKNDNQGWAMGGFGLLMETDDGGKTWIPVLEGTDNPDAFHYYAMARSGDKLFLVGESGLGFVSSDWGQTWARIELPYAGSYFGIVTDVKKKAILAFGLRGNIALSTDGGSQWELIDEKVNSGSLFGACATSDGAIILNSAGGSLSKFNIAERSFTPLLHQPAETVTLTEVKPGLVIGVGLRGITSIIKHNQ